MCLGLSRELTERLFWLTEEGRRISWLHFWLRLHSEVLPCGPMCKYSCFSALCINNGNTFIYPENRSLLDYVTNFVSVVVILRTAWLLALSSDILALWQASYTMLQYHSPGQASWKFNVKIFQVKMLFSLLYTHNTVLIEISIHAFSQYSFEINWHLC